MVVGGWQSQDVGALHKRAKEEKIFSPLSEMQEFVVSELQITSHKLDILCGLIGDRADQEKILRESGWTIWITQIQIIAACVLVWCGGKKKRNGWLPQYIPKGQITVLAGDGGSGKTTIWCGQAAAVSKGGKCFWCYTGGLAQCKPQKVLFFSSEDSIEYTLKARLRKAGQI